MLIDGRYLDEVLRKLYRELSASTDTFEASKGKGQDLLAPTIILKDPRSRISATASRGRLISALAEFCWYMSGSADLDFIRFYIPEYPPKEAKGSIEEAYGPRLIGTGQFGHNHDQIDQVIDRLQKKPDTRRAVIAVLEANDLRPNQPEAPCTIALQFIRRRERLHMVATMRSNDAYLGFPHDVFCFTMLQELVSRSLGIKMGNYHHFSTSLHLYEQDIDKVSRYLDEGFQNPTFSMPKMPSGCQRANLDAFLKVEESIRSGELTEASQILLPTYWRDLALVLLRKADSKFNRGLKTLDQNFANVSDEFFRNFFLKRPFFLPAENSTTVTQNALELEENNGRQD